MAELNTAELLQQMIDIKKDMITAIGSKGVVVVSGMKEYPSAIDKIQQNITISHIGVDYTQIGWTENSSDAQNLIDALMVNKEILKSKQVYDTYKDNEWEWDTDTIVGTSLFVGFQTKIKDLVYLPVFNLSKVLTTNALFRGNSTLKVCSALNTSSATDMGNMFQDASLLESVGVIDCSSVRNIDDMFSGCNSLINIGGLTDLGKGYKYDGKTHGCELWLDGAPRLTRESLLNIFNSIYDVTVYNVGQFNMFDIYLTADQLALLSLDDRAIATNKGWKLYTAN